VTEVTESVTKTDVQANGALDAYSAFEAFGEETLQRWRSWGQAFADNAEILRAMNQRNVDFAVRVAQLNWADGEPGDKPAWLGTAALELCAAQMTASSELMRRALNPGGGEHV